MARAHGQRTDPHHGERVGPARELAGFVLIAGTALGIFALVVLLPPWYRLASARTRRDALTAQAWTNEKLIQHRQRLAETIRCDPVQTQRLLMRQQNYRRPGETAMKVDAVAPDPPAIAMLAARAPEVSPPSALLGRVALRLQDPRARRGLLLVAGMLMTCALVMFHPTAAKRRKARPRR